MTRSLTDLREEAADLERRIAIFQERVERARWLTEMLTQAKAPHPRFPFWEWEFRNFPTDTVRRNVARVITHLSWRLDGTWEFDETCKEIPGVSSDELYQARPPTVDEVYALIKAAAGFTSNAKVTEMFVIMRMNEYRSNLIDFVLSGVVTDRRT
jgi:hypothetical protein